MFNNPLHYSIENTDYGPVLHWEQEPEEDNPCAVALDYFEEHLQVLVYDTTTEEPAVLVRYNNKGEVVEVHLNVDREIKVLQKWESSTWLEKRDKD